MRPPSPLLAKLTPPSVPVVLDRARLFRRIDHGRRRRFIIWIQGPPGAGKTTLAASYIRAQRLKNLWYQLDEGDADPATVFHYLSLAAQKVAPRFRRSLPNLTPEYLGAIPVFTRRFFQELYGRLTPPCLLVFDNYHDVPKHSAFHEVIAKGLSEVPPGIAVAVMSREPLPASLARLNAGQAVELIDEDSLRLTTDEARQITRLQLRTGSRKASQEICERLHRETQGWVAGLVLLLQHYSMKGIRADEAHHPLPDMLFDYLAQEVLQHLGSDQQEFLLRSALLPSMTVKMAERLTGISSAGQLLAFLYQNRYFTERRIDRDTVYQYHPLFRAFLLARAASVLAPDELTATRHKAARLLEEAGRIEEAVALYGEAARVDESARLIVTHAPQLAAQGRLQTLAEWLTRIPADQSAQNPWLLYWQGVCRLPFDPAISEGLFEQALERFRAQHDLIGSLLAWCGVIMSIQFTWLHPNRFDGWIDVLDELFPPQTPWPSPEIEVRVTVCMLTAIMWRRPYVATSQPWVERARKLAEAGQGFARESLSPALVAFYTWRGEFAEAQTIVDLWEADPPDQTAPPLSRLAYCISVATLAWQRGDTCTCLANIEAGLEISGSTGVALWDTALLSTGAYGAVIQQDWLRADRYLAALAIHVKDPSHIMRPHFLLLKAWVARLRGDLTTAWEDIRAAFHVPSLKGTPFGEAIHSSAAADILLALGRDQEAGQYVAQLNAIAEKINSRVLTYQGRLLEARLAFSQGHEDRGYAALRQALALGRTMGPVIFAGWVPSVMSVLCAKALKADIEVEYVHQLIRAYRLAPDPTYAPRHWPCPVAIHTLGHFEVRINQQTLRFSRKAQRRPLALLKALIAYGGHDVPESQLADALWPDSDGDAAHQAFTIALHRLRKLLVHDGAISLREGRVTLRADLVWVDAHAFEQLLKGAAHTDQSDDQTALWQRALALYEGRFLPEEPDEPWVHAAREHLRHQYIRHVVRLAKQWGEGGQTDRAVQCLEAAITAEPTVETLYHQLMLTLRAAGREEEAAAVSELHRAAAS